MENLNLNKNYNSSELESIELEHIFSMFESLKDVGPYDYDHPLVKSAYYFHLEHGFSLSSLPDNLFDLVSDKIQKDAEESHALDILED